jgi:glycosyltransferase involved in cell wall biosynthesis
MVRRIARRVTVQNLAARPDAYRPWADAVASRVAAHANIGATLLATFGQPMSDHLVGLRVARTARIPWLAHFSDPWIDNPFHELRGSRRWQVARDDDVARVAHAIVVTSDETADLLCERHPDAAARVHVVPHSFDPRLYPRPSTRSGPLVIRHLGAFYGPRTPRPLLDGLRLLVDRRVDLAGVRFELVGPPSGAAAALPADVLRERSSVSYLESLALMSEADALMVIDAPATVSPFLPSKLIDYVGAGRPIVGMTPAGASARVIGSLGGVTADPLDTDACAHAIEAIIETAATHRGGAWGEETVRAAFSIDVQRRAIASVVSAVR